MGDFLYQQLEGVGYIALSSCMFQISTVFDFPLMVSKERVVHLHLAYPDCHLRGEWDTAAFYFSAHLLCMLHVCLSFFVDNDNSPRPSFIWVLPVWTLNSCSSKQCRVIFPSRLSIYNWLHPRSRLLSCLPAGWAILMGSTPTSDLIKMSRIKVRLLPMP